VYGAEKHVRRGARGYSQCFFRHEGPNAIPIGNDATPDKGAARNGTPGRSVSLQVRTPRREESGILLARHKIGVLGVMADEDGISMIALTESHLRKDILNAEISMEGIQHYRADKIGGRKKGEVIVYLRNSFARSTVELRSESGNSDGFVEHVLLHMKNWTSA
jgi:hypothetical protein